MIDKRDKPLVLVVDDLESIREISQEALEMSGYDVITAENGCIGEERTRNENPDAIVSDLQMPVMDGIAMIRKIREYNKEIPIIMATGTINKPGEVPEHLLQETQGLDIYAFLKKPYENLTMMPKIVGEALESKVNKNYEP